MAEKFRVLIADDLSTRGQEILNASSKIQAEVKIGLKPPELAQIIGQYDGLVVRSATKVTAEILEAATRLKIVGRAGIGVDNIDVKAASRRGVIVENTPSGNAVTTAEHALCLLCALVRHIPQATASMKAGKWDKKKYQGTELYEKTLGVMGLGNIGRIVADRARGLKMKVIAHDPFIGQDAAAALGVELVTLDELYRRADFITVHTPMTAETKGLIGEAAFAKMKKGVFLVNAARGGIVDEAALLAALDSGRVAAAALDVFVKEPPEAGDKLVAHDRVIVTPHLGASTDEAQEKVAIEVAEQFVAYVERGEILNGVNVAPVRVENLPRLGPWLDLAGKLGALIGQIHPRSGGSGIDELEIKVVGEVAELGATPASRAALAGLLRASTDAPVNAVNAPIVAGERGIRVSEVKQHKGDDLAAAITLTTRSAAGTCSVTGTIFKLGEQHEARVVRIDDVVLDAVPEGRLLLIRNTDQPGVIGGVGTLLGQKSINVARLHVGKRRGKGSSLMLWQLDAQGSVDDAVLTEIKKVAGVESAQALNL
jgi:D-3-phosphoglycerate dehydrogenase